VLAMLLGFAANVWAMRGLGPEQYGVLSVALVVLYVVWQFTGKGLDQTAVCLGAEPGALHQPPAIFGSVFSLKLLVNAGLLAIAALIAGPLSAALAGQEASAVPFFLAFVGAAGASLWGFASAAIQADARFGAFSLVQVAGSAVRLGATAILAAFGLLSVNSLLLASIAGFFGAAALGMALAPAYARRPLWNAAAMPAIVGSAHWMVISSVLFLLYSRLDVLMLSRLVGGDQVGVYAATLAILQILDMIASSTVTVFLPRFSSDTGAGALHNQVRAALKSSLTLALPLAPGYFLIPFGVALLVRIVGPGYAGIEPLLKIMYFGAVFTLITHPLHLIYYARRRPHVLTLLDSFMLLVIGVGAYFAIRQAGAIGAAFVVLGSRVLLGALLMTGVLLELRASRSAQHG